MSALLNGPLNKNMFTQELELLTKCILKSPHKINLHLQQKELHAKVDNLDINISDLFKKAEFTHLYFNDTDSKHYLKNIEKNIEYEFYDGQKYSQLSAGEIHAIKNYTSNGYYMINTLMYHKFNSGYYDPISLKKAYLDSMLLSSAINKIIPDCQDHFETYRGEHLSKDDLQHRTEMIQKGEVLEDSTGFLSTSSKYEVAQQFMSSSIIHFDSSYGKNIIPLSYYPGEAEYLLPPCTMLLESVEQKGNSDVFHAKIVVPLIEGKDEATAEDIAQFHKLLSWGKGEGIDIDFVTPYLKNHIMTEKPEMELKAENPAPLLLGSVIDVDKNASIPGLFFADVSQLSSPEQTNVVDPSLATGESLATSFMMHHEMMSPFAPVEVWG